MPEKDELSRQRMPAPQLPTITRRTAIGGVNALALGLGLLSSKEWDALAETPEDVPNTRSRSPGKVYWIPMSDGVRIEAKIWMPADALEHPVPSIVTYDPYRSPPDSLEHVPPLVAFGYAVVEPMKRGYGDSGGVPLDEYVKQELDDGVEIINWLSRQPWCTGKVGMTGTSWAGFTALQLAARNPEPLKAIITLCSSDDRYTDDAHYEGGLIIHDMLTWGLLWTSIGLAAPAPEVVGDRWREMWMRRLHERGFLFGDWIAHQTRDAFWKQGSIDENYSAIKCPVYAVGGWVDPYHCAIFRMLAGLQCPRKGLIGPWPHGTPDSSWLGPRIDWLSEALRWWDFWLKGKNTGIMDEPMLRVWLQEETATREGPIEIPGRWVAEQDWPSARISPAKYYLNDAGIAVQADSEVARTLKPDQTIGAAAGNWAAFFKEIDLPSDQRIDDGRSLTFDSQPLTESVNILGAAIVTLELSVDQPVALVALRLNDVRPDGYTSRVTYKVLNLTHRDSHEFPQALKPGERYRLRIQLREAAHRFAIGHRIRIAMSTAYWPFVWPSPEPVTLTVYAGKCELELPVRPERAEDAELNAFRPPATESGGATPAHAHMHSARSAGSPSRIRAFEVATGRLTVDQEGGPFGRWKQEIQQDDPATAQARYSLTAHDTVAGHKLRYESELTMSATKEDFLVSGAVSALQDEQMVFSRKWQRKIRRNLM
jgi:uncharacterized protein